MTHQAVYDHNHEGTEFHADCPGCEAIDRRIDELYDDNTKRDLRELEVEHTEDQKRDMADDLSNTVKARDEIAEERREIMREMKNEIDEHDKRISNLSARYQRGHDLTHVECDIVYDFEVGQKYVIRTDTGEIVRAELIQEHERQSDMFPDAEPESAEDEQPYGAKVVGSIG